LAATAQQALVEEPPEPAVAGGAAAPVGSSWASRGWAPGRVSIREPFSEAVQRAIIARVISGWNSMP
jgi:hypothetical protein